MREKFSSEFKSLRNLKSRGGVELLVFGSRLHEDLLTNWIDHKDKHSALLSFSRDFLGIIDWILIALTVFLVWKFGWVYLVIMLAVILLRSKFFNGVGRGLIIYDCWKSEEFFDLMWREDKIALKFKGKIIKSPQDWRSNLGSK